MRIVYLIIYILLKNVYSVNPLFLFLQEKEKNLKKILRLLSEGFSSLARGGVQNRITLQWIVKRFKDLLRKALIMRTGKERYTIS